MQNKLIANIIVANLLWSLIPIVITGLFNVASIITIIFIRFLISGLILFLIGILVIQYNNRFTNKEKISFRSLISFSVARNKEFYHMRNITYISILGFFGIILQIIFYFLAIKTTSVALTMIGFQISIVLVAYYEHGVKTEKLDFFKMLYIIILIFSIGIIVFVKSLEPNKAINSVGVIYIIIFAVALTFFQIGISKDSYTKREIKIINKNKNYKIARLFVKLSLIFITGVALMIPFTIVIQLLQIPGDLTNEVGNFFVDLRDISTILFRWEFIFLIVFATIIPFFLIFIASVKWSSFNLTYSQWNSILTIIEPIGAVLFGVLFINEFFPLGYLIIVIFLLVISILFRYAHETKNKVNAYILLNKKQGHFKDIHFELLKFDGVCCVDSLLGTHDILLNVKTNSIKDLYYLINTQIKTIEGISQIRILFIEKIHKIE